MWFWKAGGGSSALGMLEGKGLQVNRKLLGICKGNFCNYGVEKNSGMESIITALTLLDCEELTVTKGPILVTGYLTFQLDSYV